MKKSRSKPELLVLSAPSGAGKTTLCARLLQNFPQLKLSISSTTRSPRGEEKHGVDYEFLSEEEFRARIKKGHFVEWAEVHGNLYGTSVNTIDRFRREGKTVLLDIDVQGADILKEKFGDKVHRIFISPPSLEALEQRLRSRKTESEEALSTRIQNAKIEMRSAPSFDFEIINDDLDRATATLIDYVSRLLKGDRSG